MNVADVNNPAVDVNGVHGNDSFVSNSSGNTDQPVNVSTGGNANDITTETYAAKNSNEDDCEDCSDQLDPDTVETLEIILKKKILELNIRKNLGLN